MLTPYNSDYKAASHPNTQEIPRVIRAKEMVQRRCIAPIIYIMLRRCSSSGNSRHVDSLPEYFAGCQAKTFMSLCQVNSGRYFEEATDGWQKRFTQWKSRQQVAFFFHTRFCIQKGGEFEVYVLYIRAPQALCLASVQIRERKEWLQSNVLYYYC